MSVSCLFCFQTCLEHPRSAHLLKILRKGRVTLEMCGVKMFKRSVRQRVLPTCEYHSELKSLNYPLKIGRTPRKRALEPSSFVSVKSKLMMRMIQPMLMNWRMVSFIN